MKLIIFLSASFIIIICFVTCKSKKEPIIIKPLHPYATLSVLDKKDTSKCRYYFIKGFKSYARDSLFLDSFVREKIDKDYFKYSQYEMAFYQEDYRLNASFKETANDNIGSAGLLVLFRWENGKFIACFDHSVQPSLTYGKRWDSLFNSSLNSINAPYPVVDNGQVLDVKLEEAKP